MSIDPKAKPPEAITIVDEAADVRTEYWDALESLRPARLAVIHCPCKSGDTFARFCQEAVDG